MQHDDGTSKFIQEAKGQGSWMTTQRYTKLNCLAQTIPLYKTCEDCPIITPFGTLKILQITILPTTMTYS